MITLLINKVFAYISSYLLYCFSFCYNFKIYYPVVFKNQCSSQFKHSSLYPINFQVQELKNLGFLHLMELIFQIPSSSLNMLIDLSTFVELLGLLFAHTISTLSKHIASVIFLEMYLYKVCTFLPLPSFSGKLCSPLHLQKLVVWKILSES